MNLGRQIQILAVLLALGFVAAAGWLVWDNAQQVTPPGEPGICWRMDKTGKLVAIGRGFDTIELCAASLERIYKANGGSVTGAYQGHYIFVDKEAIRTSTKRGGERWRLYFDNQREVLDRKLNAHEMIMTTKR